MRTMATEPGPQAQARYRQVWAEPIFRVLFITRSLGTAADTLRTVALSVLIYAATGSAFLGALTFGVSFLPQLLGGSLLGALPDRVRPRKLIAAGYAGECAGATVLGLAHLPAWASLSLVAAISCLTPVFTGASSRVMSEALTGDTYVLGQALSSMGSSASQLLGLAGGGVAIATLGPRHAILASAACHLTASLGVRARLPDLRVPVPSIRQASHSAMRQSWSGSMLLIRDPRIRILLLAQWLPPMFVAGAEGLVIPYAAGRDFPRGSAGWLLACLPAGMILGSFVIGRFIRPAARERLLIPLIAVLGLPLIAFALNLPAIADGALLAVTGTGFSYGLGVQRRFREIVPSGARGQAFTLLSTGLMTLQGLGPALAGTVAEIVPTGATIAIAGAARLLSAAALRFRLPGALPGRRSGRFAARCPRRPGPGRRPASAPVRMSRTSRVLRLTRECAKLGAVSDEEAGMTRFMLLQNYAGPAGMQPMPNWAPEDIKAHINFQVALNEELTSLGELIDAQGLAGPELARFVTFDGPGAPVVTDGPFPESKELLAGYRMVDVESEARAIEIAAQASAAPGPGGAPIRQQIEVRQVMGIPGAEL